MEAKQFERCVAYVLAQLIEAPEGSTRQCEGLPAITISRQAGSNAEKIACRLSYILEEHCTKILSVKCSWPVFDRDLINIVLRDHDLPENISAFLPEDKISAFRSMIRELLGVLPSTWTLKEHLTETVRRLAKRGGVILVGRGANFMTQDMPNVFHVRLIASMETRIKRVKEETGLSETEAAKYIEKEDKARRRFVKDLLQKDVDDPTAYHLTICTDKFDVNEVAHLIASCVINRWGLAKPPKADDISGGNFHPRTNLSSIAMEHDPLDWLRANEKANILG